ncbi:MAG: hypothetical protein ABIH41_01025 [Nanoarchaeota archaeon]
MSTRKRGQVWSLDFIVALLIFLAAGMIAVKLMVNMFSNTQYDLARSDANGIGSMLIGPGFPEDWTNDTVVEVGVTTDGNLNITKLRRLARMDDRRAATLLLTPYDFYIRVLNREGDSMYLWKRCGIGDDGVVGNGSIYYTSVAYYFTDVANSHFMLQPLVGNFSVDPYDDTSAAGDIRYGIVLNGSIDTLLDNLDRYHTLVMEDPSFVNRPAVNYSTQQVNRRIADWVAKGNVLYLTGRVNMTAFAGGDFPMDSSIGKANVTFEEESLSFDVDDEIMFNGKFAVFEDGASSFVQLANYSDGFIAMATWEFGGGRVFYFADSKATYETVTDLSDQIIESVRWHALGWCTDVDMGEYDDLAKVARFVAFDAQVYTLEVDVWV